MIYLKIINIAKFIIIYTQNIKTMEYKFWERFEKIKLLGSGSFGEAYKVQDK
jgi:hypothetical protein